MKNVHVFKNYFTKVNQPHDFREYIQGLNDDELSWFYNQIKEPVEFIKDINYLMFKLEWFKDSINLSKDLFIQAVMSCETHLIKAGWISILHERYKEDIQDLLDDFSS